MLCGTNIVGPYRTKQYLPQLVICPLREYNNKELLI